MITIEEAIKKTYSILNIYDLQAETESNQIREQVHELQG